MTAKKTVTDEQLGTLARRQHDLFRRVREGTLPVERVLDGLQRLCEGEEIKPAAVRPMVHKVWRECNYTKYGRKWNARDVLNLLRNKGFKTTEEVRDLIYGLDVPSCGTWLSLVLQSGADLGFTQGYNLRQLHSQADKRGLDLCPQVIGPLLRLDYQDQPVGEFLHLAMDPIPTSGHLDESSDGVSIFTVFRHDGSLTNGHRDPWLGISRRPIRGLYQPEDRWVFGLKPQL